MTLACLLDVEGLVRADVVTLAAAGISIPGKQDTSINAVAAARLAYDPPQPTTYLCYALSQ